MIVVLGCPRAERAAPGSDDTFKPAGLAVSIARAASEAGAAVELVGAVGDDAAGDAVVVGLARWRVGHAALLRAPGTATPILGIRGGRPPELRRADVELGLGYLLEYRVLVLGEPLAPEAAQAAAAAARYQAAQLIAIVEPGNTLDPSLEEGATVLEAPPGEAAPFARLVGRFAAALDAGTPARSAFAAAARTTGWTAAG